MRIKLLIIVPALFAGGSERVIVHLAKHLNRSQFEISLIVLNAEGELVADLPKDIRICLFNYKRTIHATFKIYKIIADLRPAVVFTTLGQLNLLVSILKPVVNGKVVFIARESSIVSQRNRDDKYPFVFRVLLKTLYTRLDAIICQSQAMKSDLISFAKIEPLKTYVINNPVDFSELNDSRSVRKWNPDGFALLSIGQLRREKGYDRLLAAIAKVKADFTYKIVGGGSLRKDLEKITHDLGINKKVDFVGPVVKPFHYLKQADCLLLGSYYEGFPNVVIEAHAMGVPVIAWASPGGHNEIINNGKNGWIVNSEEELVQLIESKSYLKLDSKAIALEAWNRYNVKKIVNEYQETFTKVYDSI